MTRTVADNALMLDVIGTVGALPAIVNAVIDALAPLGVKGLDVPATSERIWEAIQHARA